MKRFNKSLVDANRLRDRSYKNPTFLDKRGAIYKFTHPHYIIEEEVAKLLKLRGDENVLDVGCGAGKLLLKLVAEYPGCELIGIDISSSMFEQARVEVRDKHLNVKFQNADVQDLPFPNEFFDRVVAMHMIYHVPEIEKAIGEIARVLHPDGIFVLTANSLRSKETLRKLEKQAARLMGITDYPDATSRFNIEQGIRVLQQFFTRTELVAYKSKLILTQPDPYVDYFDSTRDFWEPYPEDRVWVSVLEMVRKKIQGDIRRKGRFQEANLFGAFVASQKV